MKDTKHQVYEGLKVAVGLKKAIDCLHKFDTLYKHKHGSCLDYIISHSGSDLRPYDTYTRREARVFERYALMYVHVQSKPPLPKAQPYVYEGGLIE